MEDLDIIPPEEVQSVSVQLVTFNGNQKSAFGSISVDFSFEDGAHGLFDNLARGFLVDQAWCSLLFL